MHKALAQFGSFCPNHGNQRFITLRYSPPKFICPFCLFIQRKCLIHYPLMHLIKRRVKKCKDDDLKIYFINRNHDNFFYLFFLLTFQDSSNSSLITFLLSFCDFLNMLSQHVLCWLFCSVQNAYQQNSEDLWYFYEAWLKIRKHKMLRLNIKIKVF